jgi:hypothetical protein
VPHPPPPLRGTEFSSPARLDATPLLLLLAELTFCETSRGQEVGPPRNSTISTVTLSRLPRELTACTAMLCAICARRPDIASALRLSTTRLSAANSTDVRYVATVRVHYMHQVPLEYAV